MEVVGAGGPGQEPFQRWPGGGFPAVASALVEVGGEPGQDVQAGHLGCRGDGPNGGGEPGGVLVAGAAGVLAGHDGAADHALGCVVVQADHRVVPVRGQPVPFPLQRGERLLRGFLQARSGHLLGARLVDHLQGRVPGGVGLVQAGSGRGLPPGLVPGHGPVGVLPGGHQLIVGGVQGLDPLQPPVGPVRELVGVRVPGADEVPPHVRLMKNSS